MDCDTARLLLALRRPGGAGELTPADAAALDAHLSGCPGCAAAADRADRFDAAVARVMTDVPVPPGLRGRLLTAAAAHQAAAGRRRAVRGLLAAACLVLAVGVGYSVSRAVRPAFDPESLVWQQDQELQDPESAVRDWLQAEGLPPDLPADFDYRRLTGFGRRPVPGGTARVVEFRHFDPHTGRQELARVYLLSDTGFRFDQLDPTRSSFFSARVLADDRGRSGLVYLVLYTTPTLDPFLRPPGQPAA